MSPQHLTEFIQIMPLYTKPTVWYTYSQYIYTKAMYLHSTHKIKYVQLYYLSIKFNGFEKPTVQLHCNNKTIV